MARGFTYKHVNKGWQSVINGGAVQNAVEVAARTYSTHLEASGRRVAGIEQDNILVGSYSRRGRIIEHVRESERR